MEVAAISMATALTIIVIILFSGGARMYFRRKFNISDELKSIDEATKRHARANRRLHNVKH